MVKNENISQEKIQKETFWHKLKRWIMWLILLLVVAGGFYVAYREGHLPTFGFEEKTAKTEEVATIKESAMEDNSLASRIAVLEKQVQMINREIMVLKNTSPTGDASELIANIDARLQQIQQVNDAAIEQITKQMEAESKMKLQNDKPTEPEVLLASGVLVIRDMAEQGLPFAYEAEVLQILAQGNPQASEYANQIQKYAVSGLTGSLALIEEFNTLYATLNEETVIAEEPKISPENETNIVWYEKIWNWFKEQAAHRKKIAKPIFKAEKDAVWTLVNEGKFAEALKKMQTDAKYAKVSLSALQEWKTHAEAYVEFDAAMRALIMNALANIRLREMQH